MQFIENDTNTLPIGAVRYGFYVDDKLIQKGSLAKLDEENIFLVYENLNANETIDCKLVLWVDYYYDEPNQTFGGKIKVVAESSDQIYTSPAAEEIMAKVGTDGLVAINTDGGLYSGTGTIREYRYSGTNVNNYVYFNCKDNDGTYDYGNTNYDYANNCETWRVVGVFEEDSEQVVKIMRNTTLTSEELPTSYVVDGTTYTIENDTSGEAYWNSVGITNWSTAGLQYFLNTENDTSGTLGYLSTLTTNAEELIRTTTYYLGNVTYNTTTKVMYAAERNTASSNLHSDNLGTWNGKIALLYSSDYGYSADSNYWDISTFLSFDTIQSDGVIPRNTSWMQINGGHTAYEWLLSPSSSYTIDAMCWATDGYVISDLVSYYFAVRPCLYLTSSAKILQGDGSINSPYIFTK